MKRISAVICELNPLHDGHRYVFSKAKENSDVLVAVMSGNFVQRGENAVYHKYRRAESALSAGADIVLELPFPFCASSAEFFAKAGVEVAEGVLADCLYFGSECGDIEALRAAGMALDSDEYREGMKVGRSAVLRGELLKKLCPQVPESVFDSANDILGAEYCRRASIETVAVRRISTASASQIRKESLSKGVGDMVDPYSLRALEYVKFRTLRSGPTDCAECLGGVGERLYNMAFLAKNASEWTEMIKTKQYTNSRLARASLFALCSVMPTDLSQRVLYTRLLGANSKGREYLSYLRKHSRISIITNTADKKNLSESALRQLEIGEFADSIYTYLMGECDPAFFSKERPVIID